MNKLSIEGLRQIRQEATDCGFDEVVQALDELIAIRELKGDQVPVENLEHFIRFYVRVVQGEAKPTKNEFEHTLWFLQGLPKVFTAPQKPVVLSFEAWCESRNENPIGWVRDAMKESYEAAIKAAGGVVKDGE